MGPEVEPTRIGWATAWVKLAAAIVWLAAGVVGLLIAVAIGGWIR